MAAAAARVVVAGMQALAAAQERAAAHALPTASPGGLSPPATTAGSTSTTRTRAARPQTTCESGDERVAGPAQRRAGAGPPATADGAGCSSRPPRARPARRRVKERAPRARLCDARCIAFLSSRSRPRSRSRAPAGPERSLGQASSSDCGHGRHPRVAKDGGRRRRLARLGAPVGAALGARSHAVAVSLRRAQNKNKIKIKNKNQQIQISLVTRREIRASPRFAPAIRGFAGPSGCRSMRTGFAARTFRGSPPAGAPRARAF